jgi:hypothetical protein
VNNATTKKRLYGTTYKLNNDAYSSYVWAINLQHAETLVEYRNIGEEVDGLLTEPTPVTWKTLKNPTKTPLAARFHYLVFLAWVSLQARACRTDLVMGDQGWLHEYTHRMHLKQYMGRAKLVTLNKKIHSLESLLGFTP